MTTAIEAPHVDGSVRILLRAEAALVLTGVLLLYPRVGGGWGQFAALLLVPDLSLAGYLAGPRFGAILYNSVHSYLGPLAFAGATLLGVVPASWLPLALIWLAHCAMDRAVGYGLKYGTAFGHTHLGWVGRKAEVPVGTPISQGA